MNGKLSQGQKENNKPQDKSLLLCRGDDTGNRTALFFTPLTTKY